MWLLSLQCISQHHMLCSHYELPALQLCPTAGMAVTGSHPACTFSLLCAPSTQPKPDFASLRKVYRRWWWSYEHVKLIRQTGLPRVADQLLQSTAGCPNGAFLLLVLGALLTNGCCSKRRKRCSLLSTSGLL
uniref:Uncharacterized protein n=1 Tax=Eutreptiella gymnastica TaxID=73025 RepID=A0A7S1NCQ9_9EUGL|mmetsp:Transcript_1619/g.3155  ORF Transcript_1619/g.3155 Transcript_1619/m.3155 type:complete len:132 (+) Transcript_1619:201-596(+)